MTLEINPVGVKCNLSCSYCYENPMREAGNFARKFDLNAVIKTIEKKNTNFTIFGGEPLLAPIETLEALFKIGFDKFKQNGIQSNGLLINEEHIRLFQKYNVHVGLSWDGPKVCNTARMSDSDSDKLYENFSLLRRSGIGVSLIITLHKLNGIHFRKEFIEWLLWLDANKVNSVRIHLLEDHDSSLTMTQDEQIDCLSSLITIEEQLVNFKFDLFEEIRLLLSGKTEGVGCVFNGCDPHTTPAVQGVEGNGSLSNCPRMNLSGVSFLKSETPGKERLIALANTEQSKGGCKGCRYISLCKGYCPGTSIAKDWRNRTEHCNSLKFLFAYFEQKLKVSNETIEKSTVDYLSSLERRGCGTVNTPHVDWHIDKTELGVVGTSYRPTIGFSGDWYDPCGNHLDQGSHYDVHCDSSEPCNHEEL